MGTYKEIRGTHIVSVTSDPPSPVNGQMWYNSTDKVIKGFTSSPVGSWSTDANMNTGRRYPSGAGTNTAALAYGGTPNSDVLLANTESYNGTSWTEVNDLNTARYQADGLGVVYTAALMAGGYKGPPGSPSTYTAAETENWNGTSWTEVADLSQAKRSNGMAGTNTAGLLFGGVTSPPATTLAETESWNGSSWTEVNDLNTARYNIQGVGATNTAALAVAGRNPPGSLAIVESWNGSSWTETTDVNTARYDAGGTTGAYTNALFIAGYSTAFHANVEVWNGSSWTETGDLSTAKADLEGAGTGTAGIAFGGRTPPNNPSATTEIFSSPTTSTVTFTVS